MTGYMRIRCIKIIVDPSLFMLIFGVFHNHIQSYKICRYTCIVVLPLNSRWIAVELIFCHWILSILLNVEFSVEWIFVIEYWIFYWMFNFPKNSSWITVELIFYHWTLNITLYVEFPIQFEFLLHIEFLLNIEI